MIKADLTNSENVVKQVIDIKPVNVSLVYYKDHEGKDKVRLVFQPEGCKEVFNLQEKIAGIHTATMASSWFTESFNNKLKSKKGIQQI